MIIIAFSIITIIMQFGTLRKTERKEGENNKL